MFIIDTDAGYDDLLAILYILATGVEIEAITTVSGLCGDPAVGASVIRSMLEQARFDIPVYIGSSKPSQGGHAAPSRWQNQILNLKWLPPETHPQPGAVDILADCLRNGGEILALGPMTNVASALAACPKPAGSIFLMGGAFGVNGELPSGNMGDVGAPNSEFNMYIDPAAAAAVAAFSQQGGAVGIVPLNACNTVPITADFIKQFGKLTPTRLTKLANQVFASNQKDNKEMFDNGQSFAWDPLAAVGLPALSQAQNAAFTVDSSLGVTSIGSPCNSTQVYLSANAQVFQDMYFAAFQRTSVA